MNIVKLNIPFFDEVLSGNKKFEIRNNDRDYQQGQAIVLREYDADNKLFTGRELVKIIGFVTDFAQQDGYVVFSLLELED